MANFKTHITTSTVLGIGYGGAAYVGLGLPLDHCMLAAGLCSVAGMLPDLDSDTGVPVRETMALSAAVVPLLMIDRFSHLGLTPTAMALAGGLIYVAIRFGAAEVFKRYTVHRGMWHSIPAAAIAGLITFLICSGDNLTLRLYLTLAVVAGFLSHLVLDEIYSVDLSGAIPRLKKSSGTALKFWSKSSWANISTYTKLVVLVVLAVGDPLMMRSFQQIEPPAPHVATDWVKEQLNAGTSKWR